mgnify:CR=1 FL=1
MHEEKLKTLLVDDEAPIRNILIDILEDMPLEIVQASDGVEAWELFQKEKFDLVITDIHMTNMNGLDFAEKAIKRDYSVPILVITAFDDKDRILRALQIGIYDFITKPVVDEFLIDRVQRAIDKRRLVKAESQIIDILHEMMSIPNEQCLESMNLQERLDYIHQLVTIVSIKGERGR